MPQNSQSRASTGSLFNFTTLNIWFGVGKEKEFQDALDKMLEQEKDKIKGIELVKQDHRLKAESIALKIREIKTVVEADSKDKLGYIEKLETIAAKEKEMGQFRMDTLGPSDLDPSNRKVSSSSSSSTFSRSSSSSAALPGGEGGLEGGIANGKSALEDKGSGFGKKLGYGGGLSKISESKQIKNMDNIESLSKVDTMSPVLKIKSAAKIKSITVRFVYI